MIVEITNAGPMTSEPTDALYAFRTNVVVTASAGTGKTFRLVALYTLLTLGLTSQGESDDTRAADPVLPSRIAATTFSRAAAAEIRERVERVLRAVARGEYDASTAPYRAIFAARAEATRSSSITGRVMRARAEAALDDLPHALIDTLHGLAGRIVRSSALELGMSPGFGILDDEQARVSTDAVIEEVLTAALLRGDMGATHLLDAGGGLAMTRQRVAELLDRADEEGVSLGELTCTDFEPVMRTLTARLANICRALCADGSKGFSEPAALVLRLASALTLENAPEKDLAAALEPLFTKRSPARPTPAEEAFLLLRDSIRGDSNADRARRFAAFVASSSELRPRALAMVGVLDEIASKRAQARQLHGALGFGDLLRMARNALRDHPDLARVLGKSFEVLLVDEFQDTSRVQRDLIYLLRESRTSVARRRPGEMPLAHDLEASGLLIVGDRKQSIYGFRGADVTVFTRVAAELAGRSAAEALRLGPEFDWPDRSNAALLSLSENRRSAPAILEFVNWFAQADFGGSSPYPFDISYAESEHLRPPGGAVLPDDDETSRIIVVADDDDLPPDLPPLVRTATGPMREAIVAAGVIARAVQDKAWGSLAFGDMAILARRRATLPLLEFALARLEIPYVVAGRGLFDTREVRDIFAILRLILDPFDRHALATVLRGPALALTDASLALLSVPGKGLAPPSDWFRPREGEAQRIPDPERRLLARFALRLHELGHLCRGLGPADVIRYAIEKLELDYVHAALPRASQRWGNIERLIALASQRGGSLPGFVRWLERQIADQTDENEAAVLSPGDDAVTLMTIHGSKGLEFRAVVLVDTGAAVRAPPLTMALGAARGALPARFVVRHTRPEGGSLFTPEAVEYGREATAREIAERRRLTYVAMTRAKERLFLLVPPAAPGGSAAATLKSLLSEVPSRRRAVVESASAYLLRASPSKREVAAPVAHSAWAPRVPDDHGALSVSTTPFATFDQCPRKYRFIHEMGIEPPTEVGTAGALPAGPGTGERDVLRATGTAAHRVLERWPLPRYGSPTEAAEILARLAAEGLAIDAPASRTMSEQLARFLSGPYAAKVHQGVTRVYREEPFVLELPSREGTLSLRGTIDLIIAFEDGSADVIDYKSSWQPEAADLSFQLRSYALAARKRYGFSPVRAGIVNLAGGPNPVLLEELDELTLGAFERHLTTLRGRFMHARTSDEFGGVARSVCASLRCGFVAICHPT